MNEPDIISSTKTNGSSLVKQRNAIWCEVIEVSLAQSRKEETMYLSPRSFINQPVQPLAEQGSQRGYQPLYHLDIVNRCPGCGKSSWHVGRFSAECAHCETALPLAMVASQPMQPRFTEHFSKTAMAA
ncbi:hypothetical protein [Parasphingorhabdus sp.]|uniref:hypothetical protein n=1 Tax=Parasphingorhabdus sp. TaxID=2709688 RepID=UPI003001894C